MNNINTINDFPKFDGTIIFNDNVNYDIYSYQYASTSQPNNIVNPLAIIYIASDNDIIKAINYAYNKNIALSIRSGGHQYMGASSCTGNNIQIDLSGKMWNNNKNYPYHFFKYDKKTNIIKCGPAITIQYYSQKLKENNIFTPFGECPDVHIGGHCQTGGISSISPAFGILADYIYSITIITADNNEINNITKKYYITRDTTNKYLADIFYSTLGGSPGNFGVITEFEIKPLKDIDYPDSRGCLYMYPYTKKRLQQLLNLNSKYTDNQLSDDYCFSVMVSSSSIVLEPNKRDYNMMYNNPKMFFGLDFNNKEINLMKNPLRLPYPIIIVYGLWVNKENKIKYEEHLEAQTFFLNIHNATKSDSIIDTIMMYFIKLYMSNNNIGFNEFKPIHISEMMLNWTVPIIREWLLPFKKIDMLGTRNDLLKTNFSEYATEIVDYVMKSNKCKQFPQFAPSGPCFNISDNKTAHSWRNLTGMAGFTIFYPENDEYANNIVNNWANKIDKCNNLNGNYTIKNNCFIWAPLEKYGWNLDDNWELYFDSKQKYDRILATKKLVDPHEIFTPNLFCIGASKSNKLKNNIQHNIIEYKTNPIKYAKNNYLYDLYLNIIYKIRVVIFIIYNIFYNFSKNLNLS